MILASVYCHSNILHCTLLKRYHVFHFHLFFHLCHSIKKRSFLVELLSTIVHWYAAIFIIYLLMKNSPKFHVRFFTRRQQKKSKRKYKANFHILVSNCHHVPNSQLHHPLSRYEHKSTRRYPLYQTNGLSSLAFHFQQWPILSHRMWQEPSWWVLPVNW